MDFDSDRDDLVGKINMNDGCSLISLAAAREVAKLLDIGDGYLPSAFQGRIGSAKGLWIVESDEYHFNGTPRSDEGFWIKVDPSQWKYTPNLDNTVDTDGDQATFEVCKWSKPLRSHYLNKQLLPILGEGGVAPQILAGLINEGIANEAAELITAMQSLIGFRKWNGDKNPTIKQRARDGDVKMLGGLPASTAERINLLLEVRH